MVILFKIIGLIVTFLIPIIQSALATTITLNDPSTYWNLLKNPILYICFALYAIFNLTVFSKKKFSKKNRKKIENAKADRVVKGINRARPEDEDIEDILKWAKADMVAAIMEQTAQRARENDLEAVQDYVKVLNEIDDSIVKGEKTNV